MKAIARTLWLLLFLLGTAAHAQHTLVLVGGSADPAQKTVVSAGDPSVDDLEKVQAAADLLAAAGGGTLYLPSADYYFGPDGGATPSSHGQYSLKLGDNTSLVMSPKTTIHRRGNGFAIMHATIRNADFVNGNENIRITGGALVSDGDNVGEHIGLLNVRDFEIDGVRFLGINGAWNIHLRRCEQGSVTNVQISSGDSLFEDGIHLGGCRYVTVSGCNVECGDDAIALNNVEYNDVYPQPEEMHHITIEGCNCFSHAANVVRLHVELDEAPESGWAPGAIYAVTVRGINGVTTGGGGLALIDENGEGLIHHVTLSDVDVDATANTARALQVSGVADVTLNSVRVRGSLLRNSIDDFARVRLNACEFVGVRTANERTLLVGETAGGTDFQVNGGRFSGSPSHGLQLGAAAGSVTRWSVMGAEIDNNDQSGLVVIKGFQGRVIGNMLHSNAGLGAVEVSPSDYNQYRGNTTKDNGGGTISTSGEHSVAEGNVEA